MDFQGPWGRAVRMADPVRTGHQAQMARMAHKVTLETLGRRVIRDTPARTEKTEFLEFRETSAPEVPLAYRANGARRVAEVIPAPKVPLGSRVMPDLAAHAA